MIFKLKRLHIEWEEILANCTSDKELIARLYGELKKINSQKCNDPMKRRANDLNRTFSKKEIQMSKKHMKNYSTSLAIKEMDIKTMLKFHLTPVRMATIKNTNNNKCWQGCRE
jgi:hypothetical protein